MEKLQRLPRTFFFWWCWGSNLGPSACEARAGPLTLSLLLMDSRWLVHGIRENKRARSVVCVQSLTDSYDGGYYDSYIMAMRMIWGRLLDLCREGVRLPGNLWFIDGEKLVAFLSLMDILGGGVF